MKKPDSVNTMICKWLDDHDCEFTSLQLAHWIGKTRRRVSDQLSILSRKGVVKIVGHTAKAFIYKRCEDGEVIPEVKQKTLQRKSPGVLGITTHRMDHGVERVIF